MDLRWPEPPPADCQKHDEHEPKAQFEEAEVDEVDREQDECRLHDEQDQSQHDESVGALEVRVPPRIVAPITYQEPIVEESRLDEKEQAQHDSRKRPSEQDWVHFARKPIGGTGRTTRR